MPVMTPRGLFCFCKLQFLSFFNSQNWFTHGPAFELSLLGPSAWAHRLTEC